MKKFVMKLDLHDEKQKRKAMQVVTGVSGVKSVDINLEEKKLTVIGDVDPIKVAKKLRKLCHTELLTVGEDKKDEDKKGGDKKDPLKELEDQLAKYTYHQYLYNNCAPPPPYYYHPVVVDNSPSWWW